MGVESRIFCSPQQSKCSSRRQSLLPTQVFSSRDSGIEPARLGPTFERRGGPARNVTWHKDVSSPLCWQWSSADGQSWTRNKLKARCAPISQPQLYRCGGGSCNCNEANSQHILRFRLPTATMSEDRTKVSLRKGGKRKGRAALNPKQISAPIRQDPGGLPPGAPPMPSQPDARRRAAPPGAGKVSRCGPYVPSPA